MSKAIALLAGFGAGYMNGEKDKKEQARQDAKDKREKDLFDANMADRQQIKDDRDALRTTAAPAIARAEQGPPTEAMVAQTPAGQEPAAIGYLSGNGASAKHFATQGLAEADATAQNKPEARRTRMADLAAQGNIAASTALNSDSQNRLHGAQATTAEQALADSTTAKSIRALPSFEHVGQYISDTPADNQNGSFKGKFIVSPDGAMQTFNKANADGTFTPTPRTFPNTKEGLEAAKDALAGAMSPEQRRVQAQHLITNELAAKEAVRKAKHDDGTLAVAQQNANTNESWRKDQAANMREQRRLQESHDAQVAAGKATAGGAIQIGLKDMRDFEGDFNGYIKDQFPVKEGADANERAGLNAQATSMKALGSAMFQNNAAIGIPLTAGTVMQAMELGKDRKNVQMVQVNGVAREAVVVNGQHVITSGPLQKRPPAPAAPAANSAAAAAQAGVAAPAPASAPIAAPPQARPPTTIERVQADSVAALAPLAQQFKQAEQMFLAAAKSGDQRSLTQYMQAKETLRAQLEQQANEKFGNGAAAVLQKLTAI